LACVWLLEGTLSPSKYFLMAAGERGKGKGAGSCPLPFAPLFSGAAHAEHLGHLPGFVGKSNRTLRRGKRSKRKIGKFTCSLLTRGFMTLIFN